MGAENTSDKDNDGKETGLQQEDRAILDRVTLWFGFGFGFGLGLGLGLGFHFRETGKMWGGCSS